MPNIKVVDFIKRKKEKESERINIETELCYLLVALSECYEDLEYLAELVGLAIYEYYFMTKKIFETYPYNSTSYSNEFGLISLEEYRREKLLQSLSQTFYMMESVINETDKQIDYRENLIEDISEQLLSYQSKPYIREKTLYCINSFDSEN